MSRFDRNAHFETMSTVEGWITRWHVQDDRDLPAFHLEQQPSMRIEIGTIVSVRFDNIHGLDAPQFSDAAKCVAQVRSAADDRAYFMMPLERRPFVMR